jgi:hypothetical protein
VASTNLEVKNNEIVSPPTSHRPASSVHCMHQVDQLTEENPSEPGTHDKQPSLPTELLSEESPELTMYTTILNRRPRTILL